MSKEISQKIIEVPDLNSCGFNVEKILGFGPDRVYRVYDEEDETIRVLKILGSTSHGIMNPYEIDVPSKIIHPYIMIFTRLIDMGICKPGTSGIGVVMEAAMSNLRPSAVRDTISLKIKYLYQTLLGIKFMHDNNYIHLDIKIDNVLIQNDTAKIADFGFTRRVINANNGIILISRFITPAYRPPEIYNSTGPYKYTAKSDIWSIGHLIAELLTGNRFFPLPKDSFNKKDAVSKYINDEFSNDAIKEAIIASRVSLLPSNIAPHVAYLLRGCFKNRPEDRLSVDQILQNPIFDTFRLQYGNVNGRFAPSLRIPPLADTLSYIDIMYSFMKTKYPDVDSRLFFCAADIYYRANTGTNVEGMTNDQLGIMRSATVGVCIWNAIKMCFGYSTSEYNIILTELSPIGITSDYFNKLEASMYTYLKGDLDSKYIYDLCTGRNQLKYCYKKYIRNPEIYNSLDLDLVKVSLPMSDNMSQQTRISDLEKEL